MKKSFLICAILMLTLSAVLANGISYYTTRTGEIFQKGTQEPIKKTMQMNLTCITYSFSYKMDKYYMVKDEKPYSRTSLVGCQDYSATNIFDPLIALNYDKILEKLTANELKQANIRFVKLKNTMGELDLYNRENDFDIDKIAYIDLSNMKYFSGNSGEVYLYLKSKYEDSYYMNSKYMKQLTINIKQKSKQQADRMF